MRIMGYVELAVGGAWPGSCDRDSWHIVLDVALPVEIVSRMAGKISASLV